MKAWSRCAAIAAVLTLSLHPARAGEAVAATTAGTEAMIAPTADSLRAAERLNRQGHHQEALGTVDGYLVEHADDTAARFLRGIILSDLGRDEEAVEAFRHLTVDHPELPQPYNNLGVLYARAGKLQRARESLELAVEANPRDPVALENLGDVYVRLAADTYQRATTLEGANRSVRSKLTLARNLAEGGADPAGGTGSKTGNGTDSGTSADAASAIPLSARPR
jgi:Flp pilus assembly protein TadD